MYRVAGIVNRFGLSNRAIESSVLLSGLPESLDILQNIQSKNLLHEMV